MPLTLTKDELTIVADAIKQQIVSAQRSQKTSKTPQIAEVYKAHEAVLKDIEVKILKEAK